jgi:predicted DNA-binding protein (MmcQ/YjbR family)
MNKAHWLSVALDGTVDNEKIRFLVDMSYELKKERG